VTKQSVEISHIQDVIGSMVIVSGGSHLLFCSSVERPLAWHAMSRDGICSIIYKIIIGTELYNNNGRSIIIFYTLHKGLCGESCIKYLNRDFIRPLGGEFPRDLMGLAP
jgi:hypothetical protein